MRDPNEPSARGAASPDLTLSYGPDTDHVVDVRLPTGRGMRPLLVVIHGGFWRAQWDRTHAALQSAGLAAAGYVVATVEYRRVGQSKGGWPGTFDDLALLSERVPALVADAAAARVEPGSTVIVGHSAGAHLALWAAGRHRLPAGSPWWRPSRLDVRGVVSLAGVVDLALAERLSLGGDAVRDLLHGSPVEVAPRYAAADPALLLPLDVPSRLVHGTADAEVPVAVSRSYAERAGRAGDDVALRELAGVGHYELIDPESDAWPVVLAAIQELAR